MEVSGVNGGRNSPLHDNVSLYTARVPTPEPLIHITERERERERNRDATLAYL